MSGDYESSPQARLSQQIESQLAEGRRLLEMKISNSKELARAAVRRSIWVESNIELLKGCSLSERAKSKLLPQFDIDNTDTGGDFDTELHSFRDITKTQMSGLESALALIPRPPETERALNDQSGRALSPTGLPLSNISTDKINLSLKEKLERHPIGAAAMLCIGCVTLVLLVMSWYHGESEKDMIYKYETQINGMKNEFDAQRRQYDETIRKLNDELEKTRSQEKKQASR